MATLQLPRLLYSSSNNTATLNHGLSQKRNIIMATLNMPKPRISKSNASLSNHLPAHFNHSVIQKPAPPVFDDGSTYNAPDNSMVMEKLYEILEAISDRVEMHKNVGEQRDNWNSLLLTSINGITLAAATMCATSVVMGSSVISPLKISSTLLYLAATGLLIIVNKIQPSQLVEEQRNATRLFKQLHNQIQRIINIGNPTNDDVKEAMEKVLALDRAYPLPLLGGAMLEKFPDNVEPAVWWPTQRRRQSSGGQKKGKNGWNGKLEEEMRNVVEVIKRKDKDDYLRLGGKALKLNKLLAISGPFLTGLAAVGSAFAGSSNSLGSWAAMIGVVGGALASVVNAFEHGGQVGMVFEMYRGNAGFFKLMEETIEFNLSEEEIERRENGELLEMKVALQLGRSLSELKDLAFDSSSCQADHSKEEFASKLF